MSNSESAPITVVTGASRGIGRGIALALGAAGATVYLTGRTTKLGTSPLLGTIHDAADAVNERGGKGLAFCCDHNNDDQVKDLFERVIEEQGRLDLLVNNATYIPDELTTPGSFWEKPLSLIGMLNVGMRSHYVASYFAAPYMAKQGSGLIVNISSHGARCYMHGPAYGAGKAAIDKMAADMAVDLRPFDVAALSLWMGMVLTERSQIAIQQFDEEYAAHAANAATPEFAGRIILALLEDDKLMQRSGKTWVAAELALELDVNDADGRQPPSDSKMLGEPAQVSPAVIGGPGQTIQDNTKRVST